MAHYNQEEKNAAAVLRLLGHHLPENIEQSMGLNFDENEEEEEEQLRATEADVDEESDEEKKGERGAEAMLLIQRWFRRRQFRRTVEAFVFMGRRRMGHLGNLKSEQQVYHTLFTKIRELQTKMTDAHLMKEVEILNVFAWATKQENMSNVFMGRLSDSNTRVDLATSLLDYAKELEAEFPAHVVALEKAIVILQKCEALNPELKPFVKEHDLVLKMRGPVDHLEHLAESTRKLLDCTPDLYPDHAPIREASDTFARLAHAAHDALALLESNVKISYFKHQHQQIDKPALHSLVAKRNGRPRQCHTCSKVIWSLGGPNSQCHKCVKCKVHIHPACVATTKDKLTCTEKKPVPLDGKLHLAERVLFQGEGGVDVEAVILITSTGLFLSRITWASVDAASRKDILSAGDAHFDLIANLVWGSVNKVEARMPPPGQQVRSVTVICGPWNLGATSSSKAEELVAAINKYKPRT